MDNFFAGFFKRPINVTLYENPVNAPVTFTDLSFAQLEALYSSLADVRIIEDFIGDNIAKIEVGVYNQADKEVFNTPLNQLIQEVNSTQNWAELIKEASVMYGLTGNSMVYRDEVNGYLYTLLTSDVTVLLAQGKTLPEFLNFISGYRLEVGGHGYPLAETQVLHLKMASLAAENGLWALGSSPYWAGSKNVQTIEAALQARISTLKDRGALGFISNDSQVPDKAQTKLIQDKLKSYGLGEDQEKYMVTTEKLRWQQMSLGLQELAAIDNLQYDFATLCQLRGLDPAIFKSQDSTYENQAQARAAAIKNVIVPIADRFYTKFNDWISQFYGGLRILPKYESLPEFGEVNVELSSKIIAELNAGLLTPEQAFEMLYPDMEFDADLLAMWGAAVQPEEPDENNTNINTEENV